MIIERNNGIEKNGFMLQITNIDQEAELDLKAGKAFIVYEPIKDKKTTDGSYNKGGIRSDFFYSEMSSENAFKERYSCECGYLEGKSYESSICPYCRKNVRLVDIDLEKFAYIKIKDYYIIHPAIYLYLNNIMGEKNKQSILENIIHPPKFVDTDEFGNPLLDDEIEVDKDQPFKHIGMLEFKRRFDEILDYYAVKNKRNSNMEGNVAFVKANRDKIFFQYIPVFSSALRFAMVQNEINFVNGTDKIYNMIFSSVSRMNSSTDALSVDKKLPYIQKKVNELYEKMFSLINKKDGFIKSGVLAGRMNYTSRNVIISNPNLAADEIILSYISFLEMYKFEIIQKLASTQNITESQAYSEWYMGCINFSEKIYKIIKLMISQDLTYCLINRAPTIDWGSILQVKIVDVTKKVDDYTMGISLMILSGLNADFDGDNLTITKLSAKDQIKATRKYNPKLHSMISHNDGLLSGNMMPIKDLAIGLSHFCRV